MWSLRQQWSDVDKILSQPLINDSEEYVVSFFITNIVKVPKATKIKKLVADIYIWAMR